MKRIILIMLCLLLFNLFGARDNSLYAKSAVKVKTSKKSSKDTQTKEGLDVLIAVSNSQKDMAVELKEETENYKRVKTAFDNSQLKKGEEMNQIMARYGEPVITLREGTSGFEKWVYKSAQESFFGGQRIYLIFDENKKLVEWKMVPKD